MPNDVAFRNRTTGEVRTIGAGWSWPLLLTPILGIPFFSRQVYTYGAAFVMWDAFAILLPATSWGEALAYGGSIGLALGSARKGNWLTATYYLKHGWEWADPNGAATIEAKRSWGLA